MRVLKGRAPMVLPRWAPKRADSRSTYAQGAPMSAADLQRAACQEVGHAVVDHALSFTVHEVTIRSAARAFGSVPSVTRRA